MVLSVLCLYPVCLLGQPDISYQETLFAIAYNSVWDESLFSRHLFYAVCSGCNHLPPVFAVSNSEKNAVFFRSII